MIAGSFFGKLFPVFCSEKFSGILLVWHVRRGLVRLNSRSYGQRLFMTAGILALPFPKTPSRSLNQWLSVVFRKIKGNTAAGTAADSYGLPSWPERMLPEPSLLQRYGKVSIPESFLRILFFGKLFLKWPRKVPSFFNNFSNCRNSPFCNAFLHKGKIFHDAIIIFNINLM